MKKALYLFFGVFIYSLSLAQDQHYPNWCQFAGINSCYWDNNSDTESAEAKTFLETLAHTDPALYLPEEIADRVKSCTNVEKSEQEKQAASQKPGSKTAPKISYCAKIYAPLNNVLKSIRFIPKENAQTARLPKYGARIVVDCTGRHLQIKAGLEWKEQLQLIKKTLEEVALSVVASDLASGDSQNDIPGCDSSARGGEQVLHSEAVAYNFSQKGFLKNRKTAHWDFLPDRSGKLQLALGADDNIPPQYVSKKCFPAGTSYNLAQVSSTHDAFSYRIAKLKAERDAINTSFEELNKKIAKSPYGHMNEIIKLNLKRTENNDELAELLARKYNNDPANIRQGQKRILDKMASERCPVYCSNSNGMIGNFTGMPGQKCSKICSDIHEENTDHSLALAYSLKDELAVISKEMMSLGCSMGGFSSSPKNSERCAELNQQSFTLFTGNKNFIPPPMGGYSMEGMGSPGVGMGAPGGIGLGGETPDGDMGDQEENSNEYTEEPVADNQKFIFIPKEKLIPSTITIEEHDGTIRQLVPIKNGEPNNNARPNPLPTTPTQPIWY